MWCDHRPDQLKSVPRYISRLWASATWHLFHDHKFISRAPQTDVRKLIEYTNVS